MIRIEVKKFKEVSYIRARACIKCKEYVVVMPSSRLNEIVVKRFEKTHFEHNLVTCEIEEIQNKYKEVKSHLKPTMQVPA